MFESLRKRRRARLAEVGVTLAVGALLTLAYAGQAGAAGPFEPNDTREAAHGPLAGGKSFTGKFETENDEDWYLFYIKTYSQMEISGSMLNGVTCTSGSTRAVELLDRDGELINYFHIGEPNTIDGLSLTLDAGRYYLKLDNNSSACVGDGYKFKITPAASLTTSKDCGEAILAKDDVQPDLDKVGDLLDKNDDALAKVDEVVAKQKAPLVGLVRHWRKLKVRWQRNVRRIAKSGRPGYVKRRAWRKLRVFKRRAHGRIAAKMQEPRERLAKANETRDKVMEARAKLEALDGQYNDIVEDAEKTIKDDC